MSFDTVDGLMRQMQAGEIRMPISAFMDMQLTEFDRGRVVYELKLRPELGNAMGMLQGGAACVIADVAMAMAATSTIDDETFSHTGVTTVDLFARYLRPVSAASGVLRAEATVPRGGSRLVWTECDLTADGKLIGKFTATGIKVSFQAETYQKVAGRGGE